MFSPAILSSDDSCPSGYHYILTSTIYQPFPNLFITLDENTLGSVLHLTSLDAWKPNPACITHKPSCTTHNPGLMTHNLGPMTHNLGPMTHNLGPMTHKYGPMTQNKSYVSIQHHNHLNSETGVFSKCSKSNTVPIYVVLYFSNLQIDQKQHKIYKCSVLPLFLAIYHTIYVWMSQQEDKKCRNIGGIWPAIIT